MKRNFFVLILLVLALSVLMCACGNNGGEDTAAQPSTQSESLTAPQDTGASSASDVTAADTGVMSWSESANEDEANFNDLFGD